MENTYETMGDEGHDVGVDEPFGVHALVPVSPVLNYGTRV
jgi:hypothetical protein